MNPALRLIRTMVIAVFILSFAVAVYAYRVEITPVNPDNASYPMKISQEVTFVAKAYLNEEKDAGQDEELAIERIFWQFDYDYLKKIDSGGSAIRLKAVKEGRVNLVVTGIVENYPFSKSIEIKIEQ